MLYDRRCRCFPAFELRRQRLNTDDFLFHDNSSSYPWATRSDKVTPVCAPPFIVALAGEFNKNMTEIPVVFPVHLCVGEGAEHRVQTGARNA
jgi:hypothetical protein